MKLLFVEDDPRSIAQVKKKVEEGAFGHRMRWSGDLPRRRMDFSRSFQTSSVLTCSQGDFPAIRRLQGRRYLIVIWKERFCPIIVYSAQPDADAEKRPDHPFVRNIKKGRGSPQKFAAAINEFRPHAEAIREAEVECAKRVRSCPTGGCSLCL